MRYVLALFALGVLIAVHELGHLVLARLLGIEVKRLSIGFGPAVLSSKRGETHYTVGAIPIGGFVRIKGMNPHELRLDRKDLRSFAGRSPLQRGLVLLGGPLFNYLFAVGVLLALHLQGTQVPVPMTVGGVEPSSVAARAQLRPGDVVLTVDGEPVHQWSNLDELIADKAGKEVSLGLLRGGEGLQLKLTPAADRLGLGTLGLRQQSALRKLPFRPALLEAFNHTHWLIAEGVGLAWKMVHGKHRLERASPVALFQQASDEATQGWDALLRVMVTLSVALMLFNLLPLPSLDGGRLLFVALEAASGRRVKPELETLLHALGFAALLGLVLLAAGNDLRMGYVAQQRALGEQLDGGYEGASLTP